MTADVFMSGLAFELGERESLACLLTDDNHEMIDALRDNGVRFFRQSAKTPMELGGLSLQRTMVSSGCDPSEIDLLLYCSESRERPPARDFQVLCGESGLSKVPIVNVSMSGCANFLPALRFARGLILTEGLRRVAIVTADKFVGESRITELGIAVLSDGAASCILSAESRPGAVRVLGLGHVANQDLRQLDYGVNRPRILMAIAGGVRRAQRQALREAGIDAQDVESMICTTLRHDSTRFFAHQCGFPIENVFTQTLADISHAFSADLVINLLEGRSWMADKGCLGRPFLALALGPFTWGAFIGQHVDAEA